MIDSNELMIGNYVMMENSDYYPQYSNSVFIVKGISDKTVLLQLSTDKEIEIAQKPKFLEPIPITEEWLVKLGFGKNRYTDGEKDGIIRNENCFYHKESDMTIFLKSDIRKIYSPFVFINNKEIYLDFIHQLQNTIFWLTKQKLQIKE